jgi:hypothetical protein
MRRTAKLFGILLGAGITLGTISNSLAANDDTQGIDVDVTASGTTAVLTATFVSATALNLDAAISAFGGLPVDGTVSLEVYDGRLTGDDDGFSITVRIANPFEGATTDDSFPASAASVQSSTTASSPAPVYVDGTSADLTALAAPGALDGTGQVVLEGEPGLNVDLQQDLGIRVTVPANKEVDTYSTTLILDLTTSNPS